MTKRKYMPKALEKRLFQEVGSKCPICGENDIETLKIHHIVPYHNNEEHNADDLIVLCGRCHDKADAGTISRSELYKLKRGLILGGQTPSNVISFPGAQNKFLAREDSPPIVNTKQTGNVNLSGSPVVHGNITVTNIKTTKKSKSAPTIIPGTIGENARKIGYLKYLIKRYQKFKEWECNKKGVKLQYGKIWGSYQDEIKYTPQNTPIDLFDNAVAYLQGRIRNTKLGRIKNSRGQKLFSDFDNFDEKTSADEE